VEAFFWGLAPTVILFAQDGGAGAGGGKGGGEAVPFGPPLFLFIAIGVLFYFLLIRPQRREQARRQTMLDALKKNDRVLTAGGVYGVVTNVHREADEVTIKVDEATNTKLRLTLSSITRVLGDEPSAESGNK
jgi:preprotein translocase subunit YajC